MKRNGIRQLQVNGRKSFDIQAGRNGRNVNGRSDVARKIEQSIACRLQHLNQPLPAAALAAAVNVSPSHYSAVPGYDAPFYFSRVFKSVNRLVPAEYRQKKTCKSVSGLNGADLASNEEANSISGRIQF